MTTLAPIHTLKLTADQYFQLGEDPPGTRLELIDGEIIVCPSPSRNHADVVFALAYLLETHLRQHKLGRVYLDTDVVFAPSTVRRPDISYFTNDTLGQMPLDKLTLPPDLCVEIISPSNEEDDRINKLDLYQSKGVKHYWIIDPALRTAQCLALVNGRYVEVQAGQTGETVSFPPFSDLSFSLSELWSGSR